MLNQNRALINKLSDLNFTSPHPKSSKSRQKKRYDYRQFKQPLKRPLRKLNSQVTKPVKKPTKKDAGVEITVDYDDTIRRPKDELDSLLKKLDEMMKLSQSESDYDSTSFEDTSVDSNNPTKSDYEELQPPSLTNLFVKRGDSVRKKSTRRTHSNRSREDYKSSMRKESPVPVLPDEDSRNRKSTSRSKVYKLKPSQNIIYLTEETTPSCHPKGTKTPSRSEDYKRKNNVKSTRRKSSSKESSDSLTDERLLVKNIHNCDTVKLDKRSHSKRRNSKTSVSSLSLPGQPKPSPRQQKSSPRQQKSSPRQHKSSPRQPKPSPRQQKSSPRQKKSTKSKKSLKPLIIPAAQPPKLPKPPTQKNNCNKKDSKGKVDYEKNPYYQARKMRDSLKSSIEVKVMCKLCDRSLFSCKCRYSTEDIRQLLDKEYRKIELEMDKSIDSCTPIRLIDYITQPDTSNMQITNAAIYTYSTYTNAGYFFKLLRNRYLSTSDQIVKIRVLNVLIKWLETIKRSIFSGDFKISVLRFLENESNFLEKSKSIRIGMDALPIDEIIPKKIRILSTAEFLEFPVVEIANQITWLTFYFFKQINMADILTKVYNNEPSYCLHQLTELFNNISYWAQRTILFCDTNERIIHIQKFIQIAHELFTMKNFHGCLAIICAFSSGPIHRLKRTFGKVSKKYQKMKNDLMMTLEPESASKKKLREIVAKSDQPLVPYLGTYLGDLTFIKEGNIDVIGNKMNFKKRLLIYKKILAPLIMYQRSRYKIIPQYSLIRYLINLPLSSTADEKALYRYSQQIE